MIIRLTMVIIAYTSRDEIYYKIKLCSVLFCSVLVLSQAIFSFLRLQPMFFYLLL